MGYTTDFDGEFTVTPPFRPEHRAFLAAFDGSDVMASGDPSVPWSECHWKPPLGNSLRLSSPAVCDRSDLKTRTGTAAPSFY